jgi:hypothetical protein
MGLLTAMIAGGACADQLIFAPTGRTLGLGQAKLEAAVSADDSDAKFIWANVGLPRLELQGIRVEDEAGNSDDGFGAELAVLPETMITPAVGVGVRDAGNNTSLGRAFYAAVTKTVPLVSNMGLPIRYLKLSGGLGTDELNGLFGGIEVGLPYRLEGVAEWDGQQFNASLGWTPISHVQLKAYWLDGEFFYGGRLSIGL